MVEDDQKLADTIIDWLKFEGHTVEHASNGADAVRLLRDMTYDLLVFDWELPEISGVEICRTYRSNGGTIPVLMLTGKDALAEKVAGFDAGADDYLTKPFNLKELAVRIRALLRRPVQIEAAVLQIQDVKLDTTAHRVFYNGVEIRLQPKEFAVLEFLMRHPAQVFSQETLFDYLWDRDSESSVETVRTCIKKLRKKLSDHAGRSIIRNIHGVGYRIDSTL